MKKTIIAALLALSLLGGCAVTADAPASDTGNGDTAVQQNTADNAVSEVSSAPDTDPEAAPDAPQGFPFDAYGQTIYVCMEAAPVLAALPEPRDIFESPSCAFDGIDITYFYPGFELTTYPENGKEHVLSVVLTDDSVTTPEGVYLGGTLDEITKAYGGDYSQEGGQYTYVNGKGSLIFTLEDGVIIGIVYTLIIAAQP